MVNKGAKATVAQFSNVAQCEIPQIIHWLSIAVIHMMGHWKIVMLFVMHEEHKSLVYSVAVILMMAFAEHVFIYSAARATMERNVLLVIHYLTVIAYSMNIVLRGRRLFWSVAIGATVMSHWLILRRWSSPWVTAGMTVVDTVMCTVLFERVFFC